MENVGVNFVINVLIKNVIIVIKNICFVVSYCWSNVVIGIKILIINM